MEYLNLFLKTDRKAAAEILFIKGSDRQCMVVELRPIKYIQRFKGL